MRTKALSTVGGIGPELAEDFSTSFLLTSAGWRSAFAHTAEAHGEGPITFSAMATQEFQWARSLMTIFMNTVPDHLSRLPWILRVRFVFALSYYPLLSIAMLGGLALPIIAVVADEPWVRVDYVDFLVRWAAMELCLLSIVDFLRNRGLLRPVLVPLVSWESWLYAFSRWPYIVWGVLAAVIQQWRPRKIMFLVTPKAVHGMQQLHASMIAPYCSVTMMLSVVGIWGHDRTGVQGYVFLCLLGAVCYAIVAVAVPLLHAQESARSNDVRLLTAIRKTVGRPLMLASISALAALVAVFIFSAHVIGGI
ncbi:glycosyltransferase family 2 protein [Kocuria rosea]|uniref:glycosyltransferase family 2 protein n=1 Tax=Kocuria rosea TaxID=1275 RepID=UPI000F842A7A|nr:glycosyltransferase [Kocuria rosea]